MLVRVLYHVKSVTAATLLYCPKINLTFFFCIISSLLMLVLMHESQIMLAYSKKGCTKVLYASNLVSAAGFRNLRLKGRRTLCAFHFCPPPPFLYPIHFLPCRNITPLLALGRGALRGLSFAQKAEVVRRSLRATVF